MAILSALTPSLPLRERIALSAREGLLCRPKWLPSWLFYDDAGSVLFDQITELPEYYLTRTERGIFETNADDVVAQAARGAQLRITELGAGTAGKTQLLLAAALCRQERIVYEPVDVSASALTAAQEMIEQEFLTVCVEPSAMDYTDGLTLEPRKQNERRLVLYIGSSIGNFEPAEAEALLARMRESLEPGDCLLLGVDLAKDEHLLLAAYDDAAGVTADFNKNMLVRLNRELGADFDLDAFKHRALWNAEASRMEMHLESVRAQKVNLAAANLEVQFKAGETIHTENSYKYRRGDAERLLRSAGFRPELTWTDEHGWFAVHLARV
ncbi:MAG: L-histidine N(alpha)-methyltransferase [Acidobacteriota bacterium]|nr:L-histidine N(alpha)-methyltransferase [Acidobacteriota bacterium]